MATQPEYEQFIHQNLYKPNLNMNIGYDTRPRARESKYSFEYDFNNNFMSRITDYNFVSSESDIKFYTYIMKQIRIHLRKYLKREPDFMEVVLKEYEFEYRLNRIHITYKDSPKFLIIDKISSITLSGIFSNIDNWFDRINNLKNCYDQLIGNEEREIEII